MATSKPKHRKRYSIIISTGVKELQANHLALYTPDLNLVKDALTTGLKTNFKTVEVSILDECPDLSIWGDLSSKGICGSCRLAEVGGIPYLYNKKYQKKTTYQLPDIAKTCGLKQKTLIIGSAHASPLIIGSNGELVINTTVPGTRHTRYCNIDDIPTTVSTSASASASASPPVSPNNTDNNDNNTDNKNDDNDDDNKQSGPSIHVYSSEEIGCASNLFLCDGKNNEPVIYVKVSIKTGNLSLTSAIRTALKTVTGVNAKQQIGLGGVIKVLKGKIKGHISPNFVDCDYKDADAIDKSRKYISCGPNLIMFSTILTDDPSDNKKLHLTFESTNFYSLTKHCNEGGVFVESVTNDIIEYEAYFSLAKYIYRVEDAYYNLAQKNKK